MIVSMALCSLFAANAAATEGWVGEIQPYVPFSEAGKHGKYEDDKPYDLHVYNSDMYQCWIFADETSGMLRFDEDISLDLLDSFSEAVIRIPDRITPHDNPEDNEPADSVTITGIIGSMPFEGFDVNPENEYMKCVDNVIFSKDGKTLMSYARFDDRESYIVPKDTEAVGERAFFCCYRLNYITLPRLDMTLDRSAFNKSIYKEPDYNINLYSTVKPELTAADNRVSWEHIPGASYYEIYLQNDKGEYELIKTINSNAFRLNDKAKKKKYTFAVKACAKVRAANYDPETDEGVYPESFFIEGTMSDPITVMKK